MSGSQMRPVNLRCEYMQDPLGIDVLRPRLSWQLQSAPTARVQAQVAYRVSVGSSPGDADCWDSGRVDSARSAQVEYGGLDLMATRRYYWKVEVWDSKGCAAESHSAFFEMGLLNPTDWEAQWIGIDTSNGHRAPDLEGANWVWSSDAQAPCVFLRRHIALADAEVRRALFVLTADNWYGLYVNGREVARGAYWPRAHAIDIGDYLVPGDNVLAIEARKDGKANGLIGRLKVDFVAPQGAADIAGARARDGADAGSAAYSACQPCVLDIDETWVATTELQLGWQGLRHDDSGWGEVRRVGPYGCSPWGEGVRLSAPTQPCPYLRREFDVKKPVARARVYATAKGIYELRLNGERVGQAFWAPGWTDYDKRIQYQTYDVTAQLRQGRNCVGAILGDGWYAGNLSLIGRHLYGPYPLALLAQLHLEYADGTSETVATGGAEGEWLGSTGAVVYSDMQHGEVWDARREQQGWDLPDFSRPSVHEPAWAPVSTIAAPSGRLVAQVGPSVEAMERLAPVSVSEVAADTFIFDMGQNMVGWVRLMAQGPPGHLVRLRFGEMLNADGTLYTANLRNAQQTDTFRLCGFGDETFEPKFTFHGFRYVEVTGYPGRPTAGALQGVVAYSAAPETGSFECGSEMVNQLVSNIVWGQKGNFVSIPTDCPQRDERMGWTGDAQVFARTACLNMDVAAFYTKWIADVADAQRPEGQFTDVAPFVPIVGWGNAAWGDAGVIVPWAVHLAYGDMRVIEENFENMARWVDWLASTTDGLLRPNAGFGDWLSIEADTPKDMLSTAFFAHSANLVAQMAAKVGRADDALRFAELFAAIRGAFCAAYVREDGRIHGDTQTAYLLALHMDLLPQGLRQQAAAHLVRLIEARDWHLSTGFVGVSYLCPVLSDAGYDAVAYRLLQQDTYPSWGYSIKNGATTVWERWNSYTKEDGFGDVGMNSFNHYSLGSIGEWLYRFAAGIEACPDAPGYERFVVQPRVSEVLGWVKARYDSIRGPICVEWRLECGRLTLNVEIPANTSATVRVPRAADDVILEGGRPAAEAFGVRFTGYDEDYAVFNVSSGFYSFECGR